MDSFMRAARDHDSAFPVNAYEIKIACANIRAEEAARRATEQPADNESSIETCKNRAHHILDDGEDHGLIELYDPADNSTRIVPCFDCRRAAFDQRQAEYIESKQGAGVPPAVTKAIDTVVEAMSMNQAKPVQDDGREFLDWCSREFLKAYLANRPTENGVRKFRYPLFGKTLAVSLDEGECHRVGVMIFHAIDYIRLGPEAYAELKKSGMQI